MSRAGFYSVAVDPTTGWVVGAGWTEGTWVTGAAQGGYDFAAVVLDGVTGDELGRYQDGTTDDDHLKFAGFDAVGGLIVGGLWTDTGGDEFVAIKFAPWNSGYSTTTGAGTEALADWEIGAIAGAGALLLLLLGLCLFWFRHKRPEGPQGAAKAGSSRSLPAENFGGPSVRGEVLQPRPLVKVAATETEELPPPPSYEEMNAPEPAATRLKHHRNG
ncbi:unnamed protein product [Ectocarpus fasciculatus]